MKPLLLLLISTIIYSNTFAQIEKVILKHSPTQPRWVLTCDNDFEENCTLTVYFPDGRQKGQAKVIYHDTRNRFRPNGDAIIYYENGTVYQEYNHASGILLTFYPTGELDEKMITPINGELEYKYKYYKSGQVWEEEEAKREIGKQNLTFAYNGGGSRQKDFFYDNTGYSYNFTKTYHSNGNLLSHIFIDKTAPHLKYVHQYFTPDGLLDTNAVHAKVSGRFMKQGRRYTYYPNGQLQLITHYKNDKISGERLMWTKKGILIEKGNYKSGSRHGKFLSWWENGSPKEISYHQGYYKHGPALRWHRNGLLLEQGSYYQGKALGVATVWDTLGNLRGENAGTQEVQLFNWYYNERNINENTYWFRSEGQFKNGMREGQWTFYYDKKGQNREPVSGLFTILNYENGLVQGEVTMYYLNGDVLAKANFKDGWLDGEYLAMHETGEMIVKGQYQQHKKTGIWTSYHHKSNQIYQIRKYDKDVQIDLYKEWDKDGFLTKDLVDNKRKKQIEHYTYYKSGMKLVSIIPYGWTSGHYYEYAAEGYLKKTRIRQKDDANSYLQTDYYPNGQKSSESMIIQNKRDGIYTAWYENGKKKSQFVFENGNRNGASYSWNEEGEKSATLFQNGIQIIQNTAEEKALECACNHPPKEVSNGFMNWFLRFVEYEKVKDRTPYFTISETSYKKLFSRNIQMYNNQVSGEVAVLGDFYVGIKNGLRLDLTACRRGVNRTYLDIYGDYNERLNEAVVRVYNFDLSVQFPEKIFRLYDVKKKQPLEITHEKYQRSSVRYTIKELEYEEKNGTPIVNIKEKKGTTSCFQISEIGTTGVLFKGNNAVLDLSPNDFPRSLSRQFKISRLHKYQSSVSNALHSAPLNSDLDKFMGVYFPNGQLYISYQNQEMIASAHHIFADGEAIYGNLEISTKIYPSISDTDAFLFFLQTIGFEILKKEYVNDEMLHLFWKYQ